MEERHLSVPRTARYYTLGDAATARAVWIVLHGYGQLARYFLHKFEGLEEGLLIAAPEGLSRFYTDEAHSRVGATWMTREDRGHEIADQLTYLDELVLVLEKRLSPGTRVSVLGFSQGVATACRWAMLGNTCLSRIVLWGGALPPEFTAHGLGDHWKRTEVTLVHGAHDTVVNAAALARNEACLRSAGVPHRTVLFEGGHAMDTLTLGRVLGGTGG